MNSNPSFCLGSCLNSQTKNENIIDKLNPKIKKLVKIIKTTFIIWGRNKSQAFTK